MIGIKASLVEDMMMRKGSLLYYIRKRGCVRISPCNAPLHYSPHCNALRGLRVMGSTMLECMGVDGGCPRRGPAASAAEQHSRRKVG